MDGNEARRVLIAGGGIAGLAMRRALRRAGIPTLTLKRRGAPADGGLAINLPSNAVWAQGAALALEDARVLAALLAERTDWRTAGPAYEALRRPRVAHVQAMTDRLSRTARMPGWARRLVLPVLGPRSDRATYAPLRLDPLGPARTCD